MYRSRFKKSKRDGPIVRIKQKHTGVLRFFVDERVQEIMPDLEELEYNKITLPKRIVWPLRTSSR